MILIKTYNANISRAIASLLPKKFANRERINGEGLRHDLAEAVMRYIEDDWNLLDAENKAGKYLEALRSKFIVETAEIELRFITDCSFSEKAMQIFAADMKAIGKESLVNEVAAIRKEVSLLRVGRTYYQAHWLVLPDGRMVLWRFIGYDALLKWRPGDFTQHECSRYGGKCVGAVIFQDGMLISK